MEERVTTRAEFQEEVRRLAAELGEVVWEQVVEQGQTATADRWLRERGAAMLRGMLGAAWTARSERLGVGGRWRSRCSMGSVGSAIAEGCRCWRRCGWTRRGSPRGCRNWRCWRE